MKVKSRPSLSVNLYPSTKIIKNVYICLFFTGGSKAGQVLLNNNNNTLFKYVNAHKQDTRYVFEKADHEVIPIKGPLTEL